MIREHADIRIKPGTDDAFLKAVEQAVPLFREAPGCHAMRLEKVIETRSHYRLTVEWESVEAHTEGFRGSPAFTAWRALVGDFFDTIAVDHMEVVVPGFAGG